MRAGGATKGGADKTNHSIAETMIRLKVKTQEENLYQNRSYFMSQFKMEEMESRQKGEVRTLE